MAGLFTLSLAGVGFLTIAAVETLAPKSRLPFLRYASVAVLSSLFILNALISALSAHDPIGAPLPLATAAVAALFLLYAAAGLASPLLPLPLPPSLLDLLLLAAFSQELLLLSLRRKDVDGIENRYLDLLLAPVFLCAASTLATLARPRHSAPRLARAAGLALHGTWLIQMAFSFFSTAIAHGCAIHHRSPANYTIKCKGHPEYHRARAIATLQFNCHLALITVVTVSVFSAVAGRDLSGGQRYRPLNTELQTMENVSSQFTLDSDDEGEEIKMDANGTKQHYEVVLPVRETNGFGGAH